MLDSTAIKIELLNLSKVTLSEYGYPYKDLKLLQSPAPCVKQIQSIAFTC